MVIALEPKTTPGTVVGRKPRPSETGIQAPTRTFFLAALWRHLLVILQSASAHKLARRKPGLTDGSCQKLPRPHLARCKGNAWLLAEAVLGHSSGVSSLLAGKGHFGIEGKQARTTALGN